MVYTLVGYVRVTSRKNNKDYVIIHYTRNSKEGSIENGLITDSKCLLADSFDNSGVKIKDKFDLDYNVVNGKAYLNALVKL